jgi:hypothetical protein
MKKDFKIIEKYPELFGVAPFDIRTTLMNFGFECGEGWYRELEKLFEKLSKVVKEQNLNSYRIVQVKEKFGGLRIYEENGTEETHLLIKETSNFCEHLCEKCGNPSELSLKSGWASNICDTCKKSF